MLALGEKLTTADHFIRLWWQRSGCPSPNVLGGAASSAVNHFYVLTWVCHLTAGRPVFLQPRCAESDQNINTGSWGGCLALGSVKLLPGPVMMQQVDLQELSGLTLRCSHLYPRVTPKALYHAAPAHLEQPEQNPSHSFYLLSHFEGENKNLR